MTADRRKRHLKILELISTRAIRTQEELAETLKQADLSFDRIRRGFETYRTSYTKYLDRKALQRELEVLQEVLECEADPAVAVRDASHG